MEKLHPGAKWHFRLRFYVIFGFMFFFISFLGISLVLSALLNFIIGGARPNLTGIFIAIPVVIVLIIILGEIFARLSYNNWRYEFTRTELRIERGIIFKNYHSVPYERIQNIDIRRGILARMFGFSAVNIQTAGHSMPYKGGMGRTAEGYIPAVAAERAEQIRNWVMQNIVGKKSGI